MGSEKECVIVNYIMISLLMLDAQNALYSICEDLPINDKGTNILLINHYNM